MSIYIGLHKIKGQLLESIVLLKSICRNGSLEGEGKPEKLRYRKGYSRRIDEKNRLVYFISDNNLYLISCKDHYDDK